MANGDQIILQLGLNTTNALSQLDRDISAFERRRPLRINIDGSSIQKATGAVNDFDNAIQKTGKHILAFGASIATIELFRRGIEDSIKSFVKLDAELIRININLGLSSKQLNDFGKSLFNIAKNTGQSFDEVAKAAAIFAQQGNSVSETVKKTSNALILMRQSGLDLEDSVESITSTLAEFNKEFITSTDVVNKFASVEGKFAVSSKTLAEAISKVGASASDAGLDLNQTISLISTLAATTQATGPRISTFLNQLLNNETKSSTVEKLRDLGVAVQDANGKFLPAIQIIENLGQKYKDLSNKTDLASNSSKQQITQLIGGSRNLNLLNSILENVNGQYSKYNQILATVTNAQDAAIQKNNELNKSFLAQANAAAQSITQVSATVGKSVFGPLFQRTVGNFNDVTKLLDSNSDSGAEKLGQKVGTGILKGIGNALAGPGLVIGGALLTKLVGQVGKYTAGAVKDLLNTNSAAEQQESLQKAIASVLKSQGVTYQDLLAKGKLRINVEQEVLDLLKRQTAEQIGARALLSSITNSVAQSGGRTNGGSVRFSAGGFVPDEVHAAIQNEKAATSANVGGGGGANPVVIPDFSIGGVKQTIVANDKEFLVPTRSLNPSYSGPDQVSIINPNMISAMGGLPAGATPVRNSALGNVPYEAFSTYLSNEGLNYLGGHINSILGGLTSLIGGGFGLTAGKEFLGRKRTGKTGDISSVLKNSGINTKGSLLSKIFGGAGSEVVGGFTNRISPQIQKFREENQIANSFSKESSESFNPFDALSGNDLLAHEFNLDESNGAYIGEELPKPSLREIRRHQLKEIHSVGDFLYGRNRTKRTLKKDLISEAARHGLDPAIAQNLNKRDLANFINHKELGNNSIARQGLNQRGFEDFSTLGAAESNFNVLGKVGIYAKGLVPNAALGFGGLIGSGFSRSVFSAGDDKVVSVPHTVQTVTDRLKQNLTPTAASFLLNPQSISSIVDESRGLRVLQQIAGEKLGGPKVLKIGKRGSFISERVHAPTLAEIQQGSLEDKLDAATLTDNHRNLLDKYNVFDGDHNPANIALNLNTGKVHPLDFGELHGLDLNGNPISGIQGKIQAIKNLANKDPRLKKRLNVASQRLGLGLNFADGYQPEFEDTPAFQRLSKTDRQEYLRLKIENLKIDNLLYDKRKFDQYSNSPRLKINSFLNKITGNRVGNFGVRDIASFVDRTKGYYDSDDAYDASQIRSRRVSANESLLDRNVRLQKQRYNKISTSSFLDEAAQISSLAKNYDSYDEAGTKLANFKPRLQQFLEQADPNTAATLLNKIKKTGLNVEGFRLVKARNFLKSGGKFNIKAKGFIPKNFANGSIPPFMLEEAKKLGLSVKPNETLESLQQGFRQLLPYNFKVPDSVLNYTPPVPPPIRNPDQEAIFQRNIANQSTDPSDLNLQGIDNILRGDVIDPEILRQEAANKRSTFNKLGIPFDFKEIGDLARRSVIRGSSNIIGAIDKNLLPPPIRNNNQSAAFKNIISNLNYSDLDFNDAQGNRITSALNQNGEVHPELLRQISSKVRTAANLQNIPLSNQEAFQGGVQEHINIGGLQNAVDNDLTPIEKIQQGQANGLTKYFNRNNLNLSLNNKQSAPELFNARNQINPEILSSVTGALVSDSAKFNNPLTFDQIKKYAIKDITDNAAAYQKILNTQFESLLKSRSLSKDVLGKLLNQTQSGNITGSIENQIKSGNSINGKDLGNYRQLIRQEILSNIPTEHHQDTETLRSVEEIVNAKTTDILNRGNAVRQEIANIEQEKIRNNKAADFTNSFINQHGSGLGFFGNSPTGKKAQSKIDAFIEEQVGLNGDRESITRHVSNLQQEARQRINANRQSRALGFAFLAPVVAGGITDGLGPALGKSQTSDKIRDSITGATDSLATGATVASLGGFTPPALAIGGVVASLGLFKTALDAVGPSLKSANAAYDKAVEQENINQSALKTYSESVSKVQDLISLGAKPSDIANASTFRNNTFANLTPDLQSQVVGKNPDQLNEFIGQYSNGQTNRLKKQNLDQISAQIDSSSGIFNGLVGRQASRYFGLRQKFLSNPFSGDEGEQRLSDETNALANSGVKSSDINFNFRNNQDLKGKIGSEAFGVLSSLNIQEIALIKRSLIAREKNIDAQDKNTKAIDTQNIIDLNANKDRSRTITGGVFGQTLTAQIRAGNQTNNIANLSGSLDVNADNYTSSLLQNTKFGLAAAGIKNQAGLEVAQTLGAGLDEIGSQFSSKTEASNPTETDFANKIIAGIKNGDFSGREATTKLSQVADSLTGDNTNQIQQQIKDLIQKTNQQLESIDQKTNQALDLNRIQAQLAQRALDLETSRNIAGGLSTFTDPNKFSDISSPINAGLSGIIARGNFNSPLEVLARRQRSFTSQGAEGTRGQTNAVQAGFGRSTIAAQQALSALLGNDSGSQEAIAAALGGKGQLANDITAGRKNQFGDAASNLISGLSLQGGDFARSSFRLQREARSGANNLDFTKLLADLNSQKDNSTNPNNQRQFAAIIPIISLLNSAISKVAQSSKDNVNTIFKDNNLSPEDQKLKSIIDGETASTNALITSNGSLKNSIDSLTQAISGKSGTTSPSITSSGLVSSANGNIPNLPSISVNGKLSVPYVSDTNHIGNLSQAQKNALNIRESDSQTLPNRPFNQTTFHGVRGSSLNPDQINALNNFYTNPIPKNTISGHNNEKTLPDTKDVGVNANINVAVNVAGNLQKHLNSGDLHDIIKKQILTYVKAGAINNAAPPANKQNLTT